MEGAKRARYGVKSSASWFVQVRLQPYGLVAAMGRVDQTASACAYTSADE